MRMQLKQLVFAMALGTAIAAGAQTSQTPNSAGTAGGVPSADQSPTGNSMSPGAVAPTTRERVPANRDNDAIRACANAPAGEMEACVARENAKKGTGAGSTKAPSSGNTSSDSTTSGSTSSGTPSANMPKGSTPTGKTTGSTDGSTSGAYNSGGTGTTGGSATGTGTK